MLVALALLGCDHKPVEIAEPARAKSPTAAPVADGLPATQTTSSSTISNLIPLRTIGSLRTLSAAQTPPTVRVRGTVLDVRPGEYLVVNDGTGTLLAETRQTRLPLIQELADLSGQPVWDGLTVNLQNAFVNPLPNADLTNAGVATAAVKPAQLPVLTNVWEIRDLPPEKAAWQYPVRLQAVVTVNPKANPYFFAQDATAGISVKLTNIPTHLNSGNTVTIEGVSDPGGFSPIVLATNVTVTGTAPLPAATPITMFQLASGQEGSQWVEVHGVVRAVTYPTTNGLAQLNLRDLSGTILVNVPAQQAPVQLLDAIVRIRGACSSKANDKRQFAGFEMWASSLDDIKIEEAGAEDPLSRPPQPILSLSQFHPRQTLQHRSSYAGTVTLVDTNLNFFFLQDAESGVRVEAAGSQLKPGDYVVVAGYPGLGDFGWLLNNALFKILGHQQMPAPKLIPTTKIIDPQLHDYWVRVQARFLHSGKIGAVEVLSLQMGNRVFDARFIAPVSDRIRNLQPGSLLQVDGIYRVLADAERVPKSLQLAVPTETDVQILETPSWWTVRRTITVVGLMATIIGLTGLWAQMLRRKVGQQTAQLQMSEQKFRSLVEQSLVGVYTIQAGRFVYANPQFAAIFGYTPEEILRQPQIEALIHPDDRALVQRQIRRRLEEEVETVHYFFRGVRKDGTWVQIEVLGSRARLNGQPAIIGMMLDITERKLAQDTIAEQARLLDLASDAIMMCDLDGRIRYWNQNAERMYGWTPQSAIGGLAVEKMQIAPPEFQKIQQALRQKHQWRGELSHRNQQGREITLESRWTLVHDAEGQANSILAISTDMTQQKNLEAQFLRAQRLESIGVLAGGIAHDLNNALAPVLMSCHLMEMVGDEKERKQLLTSILSSTERAINLVKQILTFARGTDGRRLAVQPLHLLEELRKILGQTLPKSVRLEINAAPEIWPVLGNATQLHQVLMNLCLNARDALPQGGELTVAVANVELDEPFSAINPMAKPGPHVVFTITDNGGGMPPEIRERIFDPFFTTKEVGKGTGLGLSTALGIVKSHHGFIHVYSQPNQGSCFKVYLPAQANGPATLADQPGLSDQAAPAASLAGNDELILVVDDEAFIRNIAKRTLGMFGYRVLTANNGEEAIAVYAKQQKEIALVLMDMMMPVLGGAAAIHALASLNPEIKIIAASGLTTEGEIARKTSPTVRAFLQKPYTAEQMLKTISTVLHSRPPHPPAAS